MMLSFATTRSRQAARQPLLQAARSIQQYQCVSFSTYKQKKLARKEKLRANFQARVDRLERVKTRRDGKPLNEKKKAFRGWYDKRRVFHEIMDRKARQAGMEWKISAAAVLERLPIITPDVEDWEREFLELRAYLSSFGKEYPKEIKLSGQHLGFGEVPTDEEIIASFPEGYTPAPRETEADRTGEVRTLERKLQERLYFCIQDEDTKEWRFPTTFLEGEETLLEAAQRIATDTAGRRLEYYHTSNSPMGVDLEIFPEERRQEEGYYGIKTFFMKLTHDEGDVGKLKRAADYGWLDREEMAQKAREQEGVNCGKFYYYLL